MNDDFEKRLQQLAPRAIPSAWRSEILAAGSVAQASGSAGGFVARIKAYLAALSSPQRAAWGSLAATWLIIAFMNLIPQENTAVINPTSSLPSSQQLQAVRREKMILLAELAGANRAREMDRPKPLPSKPHSQRHDDTSIV